MEMSGVRVHNGTMEQETKHGRILKVGLHRSGLTQRFENSRAALCRPGLLVYYTGPEGFMVLLDPSQPCCWPVGSLPATAPSHAVPIRG